MNSSEVKKTIWAINLIVAVGFGFVTFFVYKQLSKPSINLKPFVYVEPTITDKSVAFVGGVTRAEVENVFGWKPAPPPKPVETEVKPAPVEVVKPPEPVSNVKNMFSLETIIGRLVFILIKKDKMLKSVVVGEDILDANGDILGVLKEIGEDFVLILIKGKMEKLSMEGLEGEVGVSGASLTPTTTSTANVSTKTNLAPPVKVAPVEVEKPVVPVVVNKSVPENVVADNVVVKAKEDEKIFNRQKSSFDGIEFEFYDTKDADGVLNRKIPEEMAMKLQSKESIKKFTSSNNYELVFQANGVLIKNIKDPEVKKFFNAFGVSDADVILSVNGQSLGNKTEDDLIALYQQIVDSAKYATIELLKNGVRQKYRVSTDRIKRPEGK